MISSLFLLIKSDFELFVDICKANNLEYFQYNDVLNWTGPTCMISVDEYDYDKFKDIETIIIHGPTFKLLRPKLYGNDSCIEYPTVLDECKLEPRSLIVNNDN